MLLLIEGAWKGIILHLGWTWTTFENGLFNPRNEATFKITTLGKNIYRKL